jgi:N6-L-threonylcarbamoyladenine synthase
MASGGNTLLLDVRDYTQIAVLGGTRDDAAGECFDKVARVLGLGYPGGKLLDDLSKGGNDSAYVLPRPNVADAPFDLSFSGLKTAVINLIHNLAQKGEAPDPARPVRLLFRRRERHAGAPHHGGDRSARI